MEECERDSQKGTFTPGDPTKGAVIFMQRCESCHTFKPVSWYLSYIAVFSVENP